MMNLPADTVRRIEEAAAALIAAGNPNPSNVQVRDRLGGGSLSHISPVMLESKLVVMQGVEAERDRLLEKVRELRAEALPLREQVAHLTATDEYLAAQLKCTKAELKESRLKTLRCRPNY